MSRVFLSLRLFFRDAPHFSHALTDLPHFPRSKTDLPHISRSKTDLPHISRSKTDPPAAQAKPCCQRIRHIERIFIDGLWIKALDLDFPDGTGISAQRDAHFGKNPGGNGSGGYTAYSFTAGRTSTATVITEAVFLVKTEVCMAWAVGIGQIPIVF